MRKSSTALRCTSLLILMLLTCIIGSPDSVTAGSMGILVPAYFYPGTGGPGGSGDGWATMAAAASTVPVTAIFNPDSGPLPGPADPNYVNAMTNLENAGGKVVAYVYTDYTNVPIATAECEISTYITQYGKLINGIFLDGMTNDNSASDLAYYHTLYTYIKRLSSSYQVIGNPGTSSVPAYLTGSTQGADTLVTYENDVAYYQGTPPPSWVTSYPANDFANIMYNASSTQSMMAAVTLAAQRNVGYVYVTDLPLNPNPYASLPSYWDQEVSAVASVPEPAALTIMASGGMFTLLCVALRRRVRRRREQG
jgi:Spherulation-specific family 4